MRGKVLGYDNRTGEGMISGDDGHRYAVRRADIEGGATSLIPGGDVDFEVSATRATSVYPIRQSLLGAGEKNRFIAAALAFLVGIFGIHKFYLGKTRAGVIHLLCFFPGMFLLGIPTLLSAVVSLAETVIYLIKDDQTFHEQYVVGDKQWL
ncbi:MAG: TM2 domain-containing protein [Hyphomicrobiaceae bacterium]